MTIAWQSQVTTRSQIETPFFGKLKPRRRGSGWNCQRNQLLGRLIEAVEVAAGVDQLGELRLTDREAGAIGRMRRASSSIPDEFAAGALFRKAPPVFYEDRNARAEEGAGHPGDQGHATRSNIIGGNMPSEHG
jgi:hypothetical protein